MLRRCGRCRQPASSHGIELIRLMGCWLDGGVAFLVVVLLLHMNLQSDYYYSIPLCITYTGPQCMRHDWLRSSSMCLSVGWHTLQVRSSVAERVEGEYLICSYNIKKIVQKCVATGECLTTVLTVDHRLWSQREPLGVSTINTGGAAATNWYSKRRMFHTHSRHGRLNWPLKIDNRRLWNI